MAQDKPKRKLPKGIFWEKGAYNLLYYINGKRHRERIGPNLRQAEAVLGKRRAEIREGRFFEKPKLVTTMFDDLAREFLLYSQRNKSSWRRDKTSITNLTEAFQGKRLTEITAAAVEAYKTQRLASLGQHAKPLKPASINRELACLKTMFNVARKHLLQLPGGLPTENPVDSVRFLDEHNVRDRVLSDEEFRQVYDVAASWLKPMMVFAYHAGMRQGEIRSLRWEQIDLEAGLVRLTSLDTKTKEGRLVPLNQELTALLKSATIYSCALVFPNPSKLGSDDPRYKDSSIGHAFRVACRKSGVQGAVFHDLRHTFVTNARRAGVDAITTMALTGHKTMSVFKRYNTVDATDLHAAMQQILDSRKNNHQALSHTEKLSQIIEK